MGIRNRKIKIYIVCNKEPVVFAAQELKNYLEMLDDVQVDVQQVEVYEPNERDGICLGLLDNLGLSTPPSNMPQFDDDIHIDVSAHRGVLGGVIGGRNPRTVLLAVYRFLEEVGCRWVRPGKNGEFIPQVDAAEIAVLLDDSPSYRYRGICIEGAVSYENMAESIDWAPKVGFNSYFLEFLIPYTFFDRWYRHLNNPYKEPEPLTVDMVIEFKRRLEREIEKRGMIYHAMGHGWTCEPFGIPGLGWDPEVYDVSDDVARYMAEIDGKRGIYAGIPLNTQLCYSNPEARRAVVEYAVKTARENDSVGVLHVWLGDDSNNHCECEDCRGTRPADFYIMLLNEMDAAFGACDIDTKIAFIIYLDLLWPPERERLKNPDRFILLFAPISRTYSRSYDTDTPGTRLAPFERNKLRFPADMSENLAYLKRWQELFDVDGFTYEYYFMWDHYFDPAYYEAAKIINQDVKKLKRLGMNGVMSDQTQRAFFPTGFGTYVLAKTLWNANATFGTLAQQYFAAAFGEDGEACRAYMARLSALFDPPYLRGRATEEAHDWILHGPESAVSEQAAQNLAQIPAIIDGFRPIIERNLATDDVCRTESWEYLAYHADIAAALSRAFRALAEGEREEAREVWGQIADVVQKNEDAYQPVLDVYEFVETLGAKFRYASGG